MGRFSIARRGGSGNGTALCFSAPSPRKIYLFYRLTRGVRCATVDTMKGTKGTEAMPCARCGQHPRIHQRTICVVCRRPAIRKAQAKRRLEHAEEVRAYFREHMRRLYASNPIPFLERARAYRENGLARRDHRIARETLSDTYVKKSLHLHLPYGVIPQSLVETQRIILQLKRKTKDEQSKGHHRTARRTA